MHSKHDGGGPNLGLLLLIPAAVIIAKGAHRRGAMDAAFGPGPGGAAGRRAAAWRHGHHAPFWGGPEGDAAGSFPLPPRIERILEAWHTRAHQAPEAAEPTA